MLSNKTKTILTLGFSSLVALTPASVHADDLIESLKAGTVGGGINIRYENVDQENFSEDAEAITARFNLKYTSGDFFKTYFVTEFEHISAIGDDFFDGPEGQGTPPGTFPAIIDPEGTDILQGFIGFKQLNNTVVKVGRQLITPRKAPFHRFLGNVLWRQKWSTFDAITVTNTSLPDTTILAGYIWNNVFVNRVERDLEAPFFNIQYNGLKYAKLQAYYYDFNFTNPVNNAPVDGAQLGTTTYGGRVNGAIPVSDWASLVYAGEYATQTESDDAPVDYDADYYLAEGGFKFTLNNPYVKSILAKGSYEVLGSDNGVQSFRTPLATGHAFQGWADLFLITPTAGIEDTYGTIVVNGASDTKLIVSYHNFEPEDGGASFDEYGSEFDVWLTKTFAKKYTVALKYADYSASGDVGVPAAQANDRTIFWSYFSLKF